MKIIKGYGITLFIEKEIFEGVFAGIYFYKWAVEFNFRILWIDLFIMIGKTK
jgi:hypothetical protein